MEVRNLGRRRSCRDVEQHPLNPKPGWSLGIVKVHHR